eukprot:gb/GEZN01022593.1/.p1 GENE.gb/GEZN01022593.1/~~gb/GEZN01022593.1/.p1  ORF type:complete len:135 (-),score=11.87 gb/GEZN01022593.1/:63-467(-)
MVVDTLQTDIKTKDRRKLQHLNWTFHFVCLGVLGASVACASSEDALDKVLTSLIFARLLEEITKRYEFPVERYDHAIQVMHESAKCWPLPLFLVTLLSFAILPWVLFFAHFPAWVRWLCLCGPPVLFFIIFIFM